FETWCIERRGTGSRTGRAVRRAKDKAFGLSHKPFERPLHLHPARALEQNRVSRTGHLAKELAGLRGILKETAGRRVKSTRADARRRHSGFYHAAGKPADSDQHI